MKLTCTVGLAEHAWLFGKHILWRLCTCLPTGTGYNVMAVNRWRKIQVPTSIASLPWNFHPPRIEVVRWKAHHGTLGQ